MCLVASPLLPALTVARLGVGVQVNVPCCRTDDFGPDDPTEAFEASFSEALETLEKKRGLGELRVLKMILVANR